MSMHVVSLRHGTGSGCETQEAESADACGYSYIHVIDVLIFVLLLPCRGIGNVDPMELIPAACSDDGVGKILDLYCNLWFLQGAEALTPSNE